MERTRSIISVPTVQIMREVKHKSMLFSSLGCVYLPLMACGDDDDRVHLGNSSDSRPKLA
jgi:hypothetical protein